MEIVARAKINLTLEVTGAREDGFHNLQSIIQTISLADEISMRLSNSIEISGEGYGFDAEKSLAKKAAILLKEKSGYAGGVFIHIRKNVPLQSGMGSDSSCAAAVLKYLNVLWNIHWSLEDLALLASELGSDVPFFIWGGTALMQGRGEQITPLHSMPQTYFCALFPASLVPPNKTALAYAAVAQSGFDNGSHTISFSQKLQTDTPIAESDFYNSFDRVAPIVYPDFAFFEQQMKDSGASTVLLSGSGPAIIAPCRNEDHALKICLSLMAVGYNAVVFYTV